ncbi:transglutaminase-like domain-containing protein [Murimonas intestini]|uniref:Transglutaminase superfamily protein n=1 Tax=Murimonas intestini TaxID=1337051 RepID=A0AB73SXK4_9FIRM|nr:transglutaminase-like domain-containing protein [Murimonas intestini]MCR1843410.1 transglutaminase-like domain-containing protein [Murimonas intestini]MCR1868736.1 transglutaminase-like domain-containing protein [Murimonas intestini]MCR1886269.1 transglutaminase-like domain-containing protein [Murimonas intestini]
MFSQEYSRQIAEAFSAQMKELGAIGEEIVRKVESEEADEAEALKYLYMSMPLSDAVDYPFELYLDYARHGVFLWKQGPYAGKVPEKLFANYVLHHRINNEDLSSCRGFFYDQLKDIIAGRNMKESALEVNYWCAREATYQTTDDRTASPITVYNSAFGRCGEESTLAVSVFRSVGIPARQVYAPLWSHCDDNHAWVEVWCDGSWYFLGACEPEEILNKGWFTNASSRAMMIHSRWFDEAAPEEAVVGKKGISTIINHLERYARTTQFFIKVEDEQGNSLKGVPVSCEVLNYGEFGNVATAVTGEDGWTEINTGFGSLHLFAESDGRFAECLINTITEKEAVLRVKKAPWKLDEWSEMEITAPKDAPVNAAQPTKEQKAAGEKKFAAAVAERQKKVENFYKKELAEDILSRCPAREKAEEILKAARGNIGEIIKFLSWREEEEEMWQWKMSLLEALTDKDYRDLKADVLTAHMEHSLKFADTCDSGLFVPYIMNPRIEFERLTDYKAFIDGYLEDSLKEEMKKDPAKIKAYVDGHVKAVPEKEYSNLITKPEACLTSGIGSVQSQKILCVAIGRSLGIPSRLNPVDKTLEFYVDGRFIGVEEKQDRRDAAARISGDDSNTAWTYTQNWTLARLNGSQFVTLLLQEEAGVSGLGEIRLESGLYRVLTANRLPNGNIFAKQLYFELKPGECRDVTLSLKEAQLSDMLEENKILDFELKDGDGSTVMASSLDDSNKMLMIWLEESKEPTEHILNEIYDRHEEFAALDSKIYFMIKSKDAFEDPTLKRTLGVLKNVEFLYDDFGSNVQTLGRRMYVDPDKLPLIIVIKEGLTGIYATSGYNVGTADMLLRVLKA